MPLKLNSTGGGSVTLDTPSTAGTYTVTVPATNQTLGLTSGTAVSASGTAIDFTGIPSWVKRITVMFNGVSTSGTSNVEVRIGDSSGIVSSNYVAAVVSGTGTQSTTGFPVMNGLAASSTFGGLLIMATLGSNLWSYTSTSSRNGTANATYAGGYHTGLSGVLTQIRITTVNGTDTFDAGTINIMYEG